MIKISPESLGSRDFIKEYNLAYAYVAGAMYKGIGSKEMVIKLGKAKLLSFLGTGGLKFDKIESDIKAIQSSLSPDQPYGMNLLCNVIKPSLEEETVNLYFRHGVTKIEAAAYINLTPALVLFRLKGLSLNNDGTVHIPNLIIAKVSRPEVAEIFMSPPPKEMVSNLLAQKKITQQEANLSEKIPMSYDICLESDSGGHTDQKIALTLFPSVIHLKEEIMSKYNYPKKIRVGAGGGIGTPEAAAAMFIMGADFILTGSINQCSVEAGMSDVVKDLLQTINIQDTTYAPAGDMFEMGARVQVSRKGLLFPARANKLYDLYTHYNSLEEIDEKTIIQLEKNYFGKSIQAVWDETKVFYLKEMPGEIEKAEKNKKHKMALIFRWYFIHTTRLAMKGLDNQVNYQVHCGSALGAYNQSVKGTALESWKNRHVDEMAKKLMQDTANLLSAKFEQYESFS